MRALHFIPLFLCLYVSGQAQYFVINVRDTVYADQKMLKKKSEISSDAKIRFSSANACAYIMSPGKGYWILGINDKNKPTKGEFILAMKDAMLPPSEYNGSWTRGQYEAMQFEDQYDLKAFFRNDIFFIAPVTFKVSIEHFPLDSTHFFMIRHQLKDGWVGKPLPHEGQSFKLDETVFTLADKTFDMNQIESSELYYVNQESGKEQNLGRFNLKFIDQETIKDDLKALYDALDNMPIKQFLMEHAMPYLNLQYGKTQPDAIAQLIEQFKQD